MQKKRNIHIAFVLLLGFIYPIAFQPFHIYTHKKQSSELHEHCNHHIVISNNSNEGYHLNESDEAQQQCLICEYHFSVNELPLFFVFECSVPTFKHHYLQSVIAQIYQCVISFKSPRAPPYTTVIS